MSRPRRPSVTIYDYPEDLNPFKDATPTSDLQKSYDTVELRHNKEQKNKFWTFGRSKKKRSNSFSVKSAWSGLFGKRKEPEPERRTTITTVSTSYQNGQSIRPVPPPRLSKDHQEFEEAFGTFTRRKKYTMDSSSTYGSNLTVNGDPARLYNGSPQDNTASILGELTPKPPARRFGQVSPRPKDEIPPLEFEAKEDNQTSRGVDNDDSISEEVPVPTRRLGRRAIPRVNVLEVPEEEYSGYSDQSRDENENLDDFVFRRCSLDAVRRSNLSINSCISTASGMSTLGRKKRRAPMPPQRRGSSEGPEEKPAAPSSSIELQISEPIDIAKVTEDIQEMTKKSENIDETMNSSRIREEADGKVAETDIETPKIEITDSSEIVEVNSDEKSIEKAEETLEKNVATEKPVENSEKNVLIEKAIENSETNVVIEKPIENSEKNVAIEKPIENPIEDRIEIDKIEINLVVEDKLEIFTDINANSQSDESDDVEVRKKSGGLSRSDSFSVKEQIEQIERQIKELESKNLNNNINNNNGSSNNNHNTTNNDVTSSQVEEIKYYEPSETRLSIQANRRSFFKNMVSNDPKGVKIEIKELPREQRDIQVVKLTDPPVAIEASKEPLKIVALHISEPIKQTAEIFDDININPLPKPRRHSSTPAQSTLRSDNSNEKTISIDLNEKIRGDSL